MIFVTRQVKTNFQKWIFSLDYGIFAILTIFMLRCSDPQSPFTVKNVTISVDYSKKTDSDNIIVGDSISLLLKIEGALFIDSVLTVFINDSNILYTSPRVTSWEVLKTVNLLCKNSGSYNFRFSAFCEGEQIVHDSLNVEVRGKAPKCLYQTGDTVVNQNSPFVLFISATDSESASYLWHKDESNLNVAIADDSLVFSSLSLSDQGVYFCIIQNKWGADTSEPIVLTVNSCPEITGASVISVSEGDTSHALLLSKDIDNDSVYLFSWNLDELYKSADEISFTQHNDSFFFTVVPIQLPKHNVRQFQLEALFSDGLAFDTATILFKVFDKNIPPHWRVNPIDTTITVGTELSLSLSHMVDDPDNDALDFFLIEGQPEHDKIAISIYSLRPSYVADGDYAVRIVARDHYNDMDTLTINLSVENFSE
jgi:hypothetical protein